MKQYRIGDFARYLGVTPDLLKHYEEVGLLQPERTESGYRYYPFHTTALLIECVRLRNYGMTLREISEILTRRGMDTVQVFPCNLKKDSDACITEISPTLLKPGEWSVDLVSGRRLLYSQQFVIDSTSR